MSADATADFVVETRDLTKRYGDVLAVDHLSLRVPRGGVFGFLGPNGSGKTTTMGMLLGLVHPTSGEARIFGDPARHPSTLKNVGAMVETPSFYPYLSGRDNLRYFQGVKRRGSPSDVDRLLELVDLGQRADDHIEPVRPFVLPTRPVRGGREPHGTQPGPAAADRRPGAAAVGAGGAAAAR